MAEAKIAKHWAYVKPVRPDPPKVKSASWVRNPIDNFVLAGLEKERLSPSPEAPREMLIRRVSLDLTGLPPSLEEVDGFLADTSPKAYDRVVDRLLASPHYGERWASPWLDLARYADTDGYGDAPRTIWKYRDWVISAFNRDMPFDQSTVEQIAGDMLPNASTEQKVATGFHRNTMSNREGGIDLEEARWITIVDRVGTTASVWLGSTLACAQCHDHKYDPFTQKEFYQLFAFFENTPYRIEGPASDDLWIAEPVLELPTPEQEAQSRFLRDEIAKLEEVMKTQTPELEVAQAEWEREEAPRQAIWTVLDPAEFTATGSTIFRRYKDKSLLVTRGDNLGKNTYTVVVHTDLEGITAFQLEVLPDLSLPAHGPGRSEDGNFVLTTFKIQAAPATGQKRTQPVGLRNPRADFSQDGFAIASVLDDHPETGWAILPQVGQSHRAIFETTTLVGDGGSTTLTFTLDQQSPQDKHLIGRFRLSATTAKNPQPAEPLPENLWLILNGATEQLTKEQRKQLAAYYRSISPSLKLTRDRLTELSEQLGKLPILTTLVMEERPSAERSSTYLRVRGSYLNEGEKVYAGVPAILHPLPESRMPNRLGLAHWLVDENNPLVARVTVNRFWEQIFGRGIVETSEDFGTRGERPTHPELLDWLATEFMRRGWSMKAMHRLMVTSATYRQLTHVTPDLVELDPHNRLLARGPRFRMEAEMIRDVTLAASGLMSPKIGGPSVFPSIWDKPSSTDEWKMSEGDNRYRRGLYTFWQRTAPYPSFMNFDAASRESCTLRRIRTNTPLQALTTLNDLAFFDAARGLARRMLAEAGPDSRARAVSGFRLCVSRPPKPKELERLLVLYQQVLEHFRRDKDGAAKLIQGRNAVSEAFDVAELAAWTVVSNVLLNLDQTITKE